MLSHLQIRDFAIVEAVEVELGTGFTALTGETGAGKSILVDALLLAVGGRADSGAVRHGAERAEVTASFDVSANPPALAWLDEQQIEHDGEVLLRRTVAADGRGRAYVNGQAMPVQSLRGLGELLVDVHGQLEFQSLAKRSYQRELLDGSGGLQPDVAAMREAFRAWKALDLERTAFEERGRDRERRLELLEHYVAELEALDPQADEPRRLAEERRRMAALGRLAEGTAQVEGLLAGRGRGRDCGARPGPVGAAPAVDARCRARRNRAADRGSRHRLPRGRGDAAPLWRVARGRPGAPGADRVAARRARGRGAQAPGRHGRAARGPRASRGELQELRAGAVNLAELERRLSAAREERATVPRPGSRPRVAAPPPRSTSASRR